MSSLSPITTKIARHFGTRHLWYVCRDAERALGFDLDTSFYRVLTNAGPVANQLAKKYPQSVIVIQNKTPLDTIELLAHPLATTHIQPNELILVFKNTARIEQFCRAHQWQLLNPPAQLASMVEEKISQVQWLGPLNKYTPGYIVTTCGALQWEKTKLVVQFNHSHTGNGTVLIASLKQLKELQHKFPDRPCRVAPYIQGELYTNNNVVWGDHTLVGNINYQITGLKPFTNTLFATIGNDWELPHHHLTKKEKQLYTKIVQAVGARLASVGWRGLFGIDVVKDARTGKMYLIEINARQPASTTFETELQQTTVIATRSPRRAGKQSLRNTKIAASLAVLSTPRNDKVTTFTAHLAALLKLPYHNEQIVPIHTGAQIIVRNTATRTYAAVDKKEIIKKITELGHTVMEYKNTKPGSDLFRIQTKNAGFMAKHNQLNKEGKKIVRVI